MFPDFRALGINRTSGTEINSTPVKNRKIVSSPPAWSEKNDSARTKPEILIVPPARLKVPRMPVIDAAFSGARSMAALFDAGLAMPMPRPPIAIVVANLQKPPTVNRRC